MRGMIGGKNRKMKVIIAEMNREDLKEVLWMTCIDAGIIWDTMLIHTWPAGTMLVLSTVVGNFVILSTVYDAILS